MMFNDDTPETQEKVLTGLEEALTTPPRDVSVGERVKGKVVTIGETSSFVDFGGRSEGAIETSQLMKEDGTPAYNVGDTIEATVESVENGVILTLGKGKAPVDLSFIDAAAELKTALDGMVKAVNKGGLVVDVNGVRAFCPVAQIDLSYVADPSVFVGRRLQFRILQWDKSSKNLVVSRRALLQEERDQKGAEIRNNLAPGQEFEGTVRRLAPFGAFIDLGGVEGLAHISELSLSRVNHPSEVVKEGDRIRVKVIKVEDLGGPKERISLSVKALAADPWSNVAETFREGESVAGTIVRLTDFGAFVELAPGIDGLVHVSELAHRQVAHPRDAVQVGDKVNARVLKVDPSKKRISLSIKALEEAPAGAISGGGGGGKSSPAVSAQVGQVVDGTVASVKTFGVFVNLPSLGNRVSGLVPRPETGLPRNADLAKKFPVGSPVKAEIIAIDEQNRIRLSIHSAEQKAERAEADDYRRGQTARPAETSFGPLAELLRPLKEKMESGGER
jgi:small subunit ribosomal protein S1